MAKEDKEREDYSEIDNPYNDNLERENQDSIISDDNQVLNKVPKLPGSSGKYGGSAAIAASSEENPGEGTGTDVPEGVIDGGHIDDLFITSFIKSKDYKPGKVGFYLDGRTGYAEFTNVDVIGTFTAANIHIPDVNQSSDSFHVDGSGNTWWGATKSSYTSNKSNADAYVLNTGEARFQNIKADTDVTVQDVQPGSDLGMQQWQQTMTFSAVDPDTVSWTSGTVEFMAGDNYNINSGDTGNMGSKTYIYFDKAASNSLQISTNAADAVGNNKILIGIASPGSNEANFQIFGGGGGLLINKGSIEQRTLTANKIAANEITGNEISALNILGKTIKADTGEIGGWTLGSNKLSSGSVEINSNTEQLLFGSATDSKTGVGVFIGNDSGDYEFRAGDPGGDNIHWDGSTLDITGKITADSGEIGGWTINSNSLASANITLDDGNDKITVGSGVTLDGATGSITATSGDIGGWVLSTNQLNSSSSNITLDASTEQVTVGSGTTINIDGANNRIRTSNYVSGVNGQGFTVEPDLIESNNISARGKIKTAVFQKDTISSVGGSVTVLDSDKLDTNMNSQDSEDLTIEGNTTFAVGDILRIKEGSDDEWFEVTNASSAPTYGVTRDKAGNYATDSNPAWNKGATVVNYKSSGEGGLLMTSGQTNAPYLEVFDHSGSPWSSVNTRLRLGKLNGFLGYTTDKFGIAIGDSTDSLKYDNTNGLRIKGSITANATSSLPVLPTEQNLVGYWNFDEGSGNKAIDQSDNSNNGTINSAIYTNGISGQALEFTQSGEDVTVTAASGINNIFSNKGAISVWFNADDAGENQEGRILDKNNWSLFLSDVSGSKCKIKFIAKHSNTNGQWVSSTRVVEFGTWHHIVIVYNQDSNSNDPTFVFDKEDITISEQSTPDGSYSGDAGDDLTVGNATSFSASFDGVIDEPRLYDDALSTFEARGLHNNPSGTSRSGVKQTGGSYASSPSGARVKIFPDSNTGLQIIDDSSNDVFKAIVGGTDVGDVIIGDYGGGNGIKWDKSAGTMTLRGDGSDVTNVDGANLQTNSIAANKMSVTSLSAINADLGTITAGSATFTKQGKTKINPSGDLGLEVLDDNRDPVFQTYIDGSQVGDVVMGDYANNQGAQWDKSEQEFSVRGKIEASQGVTFGGDGSDGALHIRNAASMDFTRSNTDYLSISDSNQTGLDITGDITLEAWVKVDSAPGSDVEYEVLSKGSAYIFSYLDDNGTKKLRLTLFENNSVETYDVNQDLGTGTWKHIAVRWDSSASQAEFYVDGSSQGTASGTFTSIDDSSNDFTISTSAKPFDGRIDEARVWSEHRVEAELVGDRQDEIDSNRFNLEGYWRLNNSTKGYANGNDLTQNNSPSFGSDTPSTLPNGETFIVEADTPYNFTTIDIESNGTLQVQEAMGQSVEFNSAVPERTRISDSDQTGLDLSGNFTIEGWIRPTGGGFHLIAGKWGGGDHSYRFYYDDNNGDIEFTISSDGSNSETVKNTISISQNRWNHVAVVYDGSADEAEFFLNGSSVGTKTFSSITGAIHDGTDRFTIGGLHGGGTNFEGQVDEVRIWSDKRTSTEIQDNYNKEIEGNEANLEGYWMFKWNYLDETTNDNNLEPVNTPTFSELGPFGKRGNGGAIVNATGDVNIEGTIDCRGVIADEKKVRAFGFERLWSGTKISPSAKPLFVRGGGGGAGGNGTVDGGNGGAGGDAHGNGDGSGGAGGTATNSDGNPGSPGSDGDGKTVAGGGGGGGAGAASSFDGSPGEPGANGGDANGLNGGNGGDGGATKDNEHDGGGGGGGGGAGLYTGDGGDGGKGGSTHDGDGGDGGHGGNSGAYGGVGGQGGAGGWHRGAHGRGGNGGDGGDGYDAGGNAGNPGSANPDGNGGNGGNALFGPGGDATYGVIGGDGGHSRFGNGGNGAASNGNLSTGGRGGDGYNGGYGGSGDPGGRGGDGSTGVAQFYLYTNGDLDFSGTVTAPGGDGGDGGNGNNNNNGAGGDGGNAGDGSDVTMLCDGTLTNTGTVNNSGGTGGTGGSDGGGGAGSDGSDGEDGTTIIAKVVVG